MRTIPAWACLAALAFGAGAQDLPPGVLLLSRIKARAVKQLEELPNVTCLETMNRYAKSEKPNSKMRLVDVVRLEVLFNGKQELFSSPGGLDFSDENPGAFVAGGMIGNGVFGSFMRGIFLNLNTLFTWRGEEALQGRAAVRYDLEIPLTDSGLNITAGGASGTVGLKGSFWANPQTLDILRFELNATEIPPALSLASTTISTDYSKVQIGGSDVWLPESAEFEMVKTSGEENRNDIEFTHCRSFQSASNISFAPPPTPIGLPPSAVPRTLEWTLPPGLEITLVLADDIDERAAVGALVNANVAGDVQFQRKVLVRHGALVRGRIRRLERHSDDGSYFVVSLEFTEIQTEKSMARFFADLQTADQISGIEPFRSGSSNFNREVSGIVNGTVTTTTRIRLPELPGVGSLLYRGDHLRIPKGFRMTWKTR